MRTDLPRGWHEYRRLISDSDTIPGTFTWFVLFHTQAPVSLSGYETEL